MIEFFMAMRPPTRTAQEKKIMVRGGKPVFYEEPELKTARTKLTDSLAPNAPQSPMTGPLELVVKWCFLPSELPDLPKDELLCWHEWRMSRPDTDNLNKMLKDCMTRTGFWKDDAQVCREIIEKHWAAVPGIYIRIKTLEE